MSWLQTEWGCCDPWDACIFGLEFSAGLSPGV